MKGPMAWLAAVAAFIAVIAAISRLLKSKTTSPTIEDSAKALGNLFNGVFR